MNKKCVICGAEFDASSVRHKNCSVECSNEYRRKYQRSPEYKKLKRKQRSKYQKTTKYMEWRCKYKQTRKAATDFFTAIGIMESLADK
jgi:hypothetical protein